MSSITTIAARRVRRAAPLCALRRSGAAGAPFAPAAASQSTTAVTDHATDAATGVIVESTRPRPGGPPA